MSERQQLELSYKRLGEIMSGFQALKQRRLPNVNVDLRVASQYRRLVGVYEDYQTVRKKIIAEHELPGSDASDEIKLENKLELRNKLDQLDAQTVKVDAPLKRLSREDLPQTFKGDGGDQNTAGLAAIMAALAPEFFDLPDEADL